MLQFGATPLVIVPDGTNVAVVVQPLLFALEYVALAVPLQPFVIPVR